MPPEIFSLRKAAGREWSTVAGRSLDTAASALENHAFILDDTPSFWQVTSVPTFQNRQKQEGHKCANLKISAKSAVFHLEKRRFYSLVFF